MCVCVFVYKVDRKEETKSRYTVKRILPLTPDEKGNDKNNDEKQSKTKTSQNAERLAQQVPARLSYAQNVKACIKSICIK